MKPIPFDPDRFQSNPLERSFFCPIRLGADTMQVPYRIPDFQKRYLDCSTKRDKGKVIAEFALKMGLGSDNTELWLQIQADWIEPVIEKAA